METTSFDFDEWLALAKSSPEIFEQRRREYLHATILRNGDTPRLKAMQSRIDLERVRARTPFKACLKIYGLMWDSFLHMDERLIEFQFLLLDPGGARPAGNCARQARLLTFKPRH